MPMAVPTMPDSARGVSKTRASPNLAASPSVTRKTPPSGPTSSPKTRTVSSSLSASASAWFSAAAIVTSGVVTGRCVAAFGDRGHRDASGSSAAAASSADSSCCCQRSAGVGSA